MRSSPTLMSVLASLDQDLAPLAGDRRLAEIGHDANSEGHGVVLGVERGADGSVDGP